MLVSAIMTNEAIKSISSSKLLERSLLEMLGLIINQSTMTMVTETTGKALAIANDCSKIQDKGKVTVVITTNEINMTTTIIKKSGTHTRDQGIATLTTELLKSKTISTLTSRKLHLKSQKNKSMIYAKICLKCQAKTRKECNNVFRMKTRVCLGILLKRLQKI